MKLLLKIIPISRLATVLKPYPIYDQNGQNFDKSGRKTVPFGVARMHIYLHNPYKGRNNSPSSPAGEVSTKLMCLVWAVSIYFRFLTKVKSMDTLNLSAACRKRPQNAQFRKIFWGGGMPKSP